MSNRLESEAFKKKIHDALSENKVKDSLMAMVRLKLVEKLGGDTRSGIQSKDIGNLSLTDKLCLSMIRNYLVSKDLLMTVSVLDPEAGHQANLDDNQVGEILGKNRPGFLDTIRTGAVSQGASPVLLSSLIEGVMANSLEKYDSSTQTSNSIGDLDIDQKLMMLEQQYVDGQKSMISQSRNLLSEKLKELEGKYNTELSLQASRIRDSEAVKIRAEESKRWREKLQSDRDEMERHYNSKLHALRDMERKALEQYTDKVRRLEEEYGGRVKSMNLHSEFAEKEAGIKTAEVSIARKDLERQRDALQSLERDIKAREREVSLQESTFDGRVNQEVETYKAVTLREIGERKQNLDNKLRKLEEELRGIEEMRRRMQNMAERNLRLEKELDDERKVKIRSSRNLRL